MSRPVEGSLNWLLARVALVISILCFTWQPANSDWAGLPTRQGPPPETTPGVPHTQIGAEQIPELSTEILRRVAALPGVEIRPTVIGQWGTKGFWIGETVALASPKAIYRGREFAHLHPDGSLHASLPPERAAQAVAAGWAVYHPSAQYHERLRGFVMLFAPRTADEVEVTIGLIVDGYSFVVGARPD